MALAAYPVGVERGFWTRSAAVERTLVPWAVVASLSFTPEIVLPAISYCIHQAKLAVTNAYDFKAAFNPTDPGKSGNPFGWWVSLWHFGSNIGSTVLMIENFRSDLLWRLMRECPLSATGRGGRDLREDGCREAHT